MQQELVSVVVPIYNTAQYLPRCIDSILGQSYEHLQVILVDDGSSDASLSIAHTYAQCDARVQVLHQENSGQSAARNLGMQHATGVYLSFVDSDDYLDADFYATLVAAIQGRDCVQIGYRRIYDKGGRVNSFRSTHFYKYTCPWLRFFRRAFLEQNAIRFPVDMIYEDVVFSLQLWAAQPSYSIVWYAGYNYCYRPNSVTAKRNKEAEKRLFAAIKQVKAPLWLKVYTEMRLRLHFVLQGVMA